ncbi:MAG TPA: hypothetical protein VHR66_23255 [Gemmataceae bacterium]|jgi:hypothetical protein|nr:hypothetical protein [Gemmataceae bacterium]
MRTTSLMMILLLAVTASADDKARTVVEAAIKAHGGDAKLAKLRTMRIKVEGMLTLTPDRPAVPFTIEDVWQTPDKHRSELTFSFMDSTIKQVQVVDGPKAWASINGTVTDMTKEALAEMKEQMYAEELDRLGFLGDKQIQVSLVDEIKVAGMPAAGVLVKSAGHRDVKLYFDKKSELLVRREALVHDPESGKEVTQAVDFADYAETHGVKHYKTVAVYRDGKKMIEGKVSAVEFLDKVDARLFAKP